MSTFDSGLVGLNRSGWRQSTSENPMLACPIPHRPRDVGIPERTPDLAQIEGAHLLANSARPFLGGCGFDDGQILRWAETYITEEGSGDVECFVAWIHSCVGTR